jgi:hypothetical protein
MQSFNTIESENSSVHQPPQANFTGTAKKEPEYLQKQVMESNAPKVVK